MKVQILIRANKANETGLVAEIDPKDPLYGKLNIWGGYGDSERDAIANLTQQIKSALNRPLPEEPKSMEIEV